MFCEVTLIHRPDVIFFFHIGDLDVNNKCCSPAGCLTWLSFRWNMWKKASHSLAESTVRVQSVQFRADWLSPAQTAATWVLTFVRLTRMCPKCLCRFAVTCCCLSFQNNHETPTNLIPAPSETFQ